MRIKSAGVLAPIIATAVVLGTAGCGDQGHESNAPTATAGTSGAQVEIGNTITFGSFRTVADVDCGKGKALNIGGSNNTLTVTGVCTTINIGGAENHVTVAEVHQTISVLGVNNTVVYRTGDPKIDDLGSGNTIRKG
ncbi:hypothetical protein A5642_08635 [Mycolicibacterium mucogenicum]|uniref:DUF3060 domain-containing protein n=1 Tax=Mycolicibacterium mucogenicum TaxID=56689 RepID=A0A1A0N657_MYCMU|nr:DUF3060 domain-containing protein [Mycolicibacterium mucogenicum]OBA92806.1 hypothetical protein A5642_08635 [Mycolicibacterium mucogenicum]